MKLLNHCPVCGSADIRPYAMKFLSGFPHISRTACRKCGIVFANPMATAEELMVFYSNYYDKGNFGALSYKGRVSEKIRRLNEEDPAIAAQQKANILKYVSEGEFLDVGCGLGEELAVFDKLGFRINGTELDNDCIGFIHSFLPKANLFHGDLLEARYPAHFFDLVNLFHVIEHLIDPDAYLAELARIIKPGGILLIGTPDIAAPAYRLFRLFNFLTFRIPKIVDGLEHTIIFNKANLHSIVSKHGFDIVEHYGESLGDSLANIISSNLSFKKKLVRYAQTFVKVNQVIIARKRG